MEYAAKPEKNEYYTYDKQGNILEKRIGNSIYKYTYGTANQLIEIEFPEGKREYFYDTAGYLLMEKLNGKIDVAYKYGYLDKVVEVNRKGKTTKFVYEGAIKTNRCERFTGKPYDEDLQAFVFTFRNYDEKNLPLAVVRSYRIPRRD